jgi:hypothetical protein
LQNVIGWYLVASCALGRRWIRWLAFAVGLGGGCVELDPDYVPTDGTGGDWTSTGSIPSTMTEEPIEPSTGSQDTTDGADPTARTTAETGSGDASSGSRGESGTDATGSGESSTGEECVDEICDGVDNDCDGTVDNGCGGCVETVSDGGFEGGTPSVAWTEYSLAFGTPLCTVAVCGLGGGSGPHGGTWWSWFGGYDGYEIGSITQTITIPVGTATLGFWLEIPVCAGEITDSLVVTIDAAEVISFDNADPACEVIGYVQHSIDVTSYADGGVHTLEFVGEVFGNGPPTQSVTNFMVDDVSLQSCD